ncbi:hypothetical protein EJB05_13131, partial [Eragrostis curvula]
MRNMDQLFSNPIQNRISSPDTQIFSGDQLAWPNLDLEDDINELSAPVVKDASLGGNSLGGSSSLKKLSHNAYERARRKELNELYSSLRSLLPDASHTKKQSIPSTVSRALKYISELQKQVDILERRKKELTTANCKPGVLNKTDSITPVVSVSCPNDTETIVAVNLLSDVAAAALPLSDCIKVLEDEGLHLISSSTYSTTQNRTFYSLHLQVHV